MSSKTLLLVFGVFVFLLLSSETKNVVAQDDCPNVLPVNIEANSRARVIPEQGNINVRDNPSVNGNRITQVQPNSEFLVTDGPVCNDGYRWWLIQIDENTEGWLADGDNEDYWIEQIIDSSTTCYTTPDGLHSFRYPSDWYVDIVSILGFRSIVINNIDEINSSTMVSDAFNNQFNLRNNEIYIAFAGPTSNISLMMFNGFEAIGGKRYYASESTTTLSGNQEIVSIQVSIENGQSESGLSWDVTGSFRPEDRARLEPMFWQILGSLSNIPCEPPPPEPALTLFGGDPVWNSDGTKILTVYEDIATVWDAETGRLLVRLDHTGLTFEGEQVYTYAGGAGWSPNERIIITWSMAYMHFWDSTSGELLLTTDCKCNPSGGYYLNFEGVVPSPDGLHLLSYGDVGTLLWDYEGNLISQLEEPSARVVFPENGRRIPVVWNQTGTHVFGGAGGETLVWIWNPFENSLLANIASPPSLLVPIPAWSPNRDRYLWVQDGIIFVADDVDDDSPIIIEPEFEYGVDAVWSFDGTRILAYGGLDNVLAIIDATSGQLLLTIDEVDITENESQVSFLSAILSPDNSRIAVDAFREIYVFDAVNGERVETLPLDNNTRMRSWHPSNLMLLSSSNAQVQVWDLTDPFNAIDTNLPNYVIQVQQIQFSEDETLLELFGQVLNLGGNTEISTDVAIIHALTGQPIATQALQPLENEEIASFTFSIPTSELPQTEIIPLTAIVGIPEIEVLNSSNSYNNYYTFGVSLNCPQFDAPCAVAPDALEINETVRNLISNTENITYYTNASEYPHSDVFLSGLESVRDDVSSALDLSAFGLTVVENIEDYGDGSLGSVDIACTLVDATLLSQEFLSSPELDSSSQQSAVRFRNVCVAIDVGRSLVLGAAAAPAGALSYLNFVINVDYIQAGHTVGDFVDNLFLDRVNDWATSCPLSRYMFPELCDSE